MAKSPFWDRWGWALVSVGAPWVAQRVWPMPQVPGNAAPFSVFSYRPETLPDTFASRIFSLPTTAMPAESYPRYSIRVIPSRRMGATCLLPVNPMIPHMSVYLLM